MTSIERKILKCLWDAKGRAHVNAVSRNVGIGTDYTRLICRSLARAGYLKFADASVCYLLTKGRNHFQRNDELATEERSEGSPIILVSSTSIPSVDGHDSDDKENVEHEDKSGGQEVNDSELDRALESISSPASSQSEESKEEDVEKKEEEVNTDVGSLQTELKEETKTTENIEQPSEEQEISISPESEEKARATAILEETPQAVLASTTTVSEKTIEVGEEMKKALEEAGGKTQATIEENLQPETKKSQHLDEPKEAAAQQKEKPTEGLVEAGISKLIHGISISIKKAVNWINHAPQTGVMNEADRKDKK